MRQNRFDLDMTQGETFQLQVYIQDANTNPIDLSTYTGILAIKTDYANAYFSEQLSTANGEIVMGANQGWYNLTLPATRTANVYVDPTAGYPPKSIYVYDFTITNNAISTKIMYGNINFYGQVL